MVISSPVLRFIRASWKNIYLPVMTVIRYNYTNNKNSSFSLYQKQDSYLFIKIVIKWFYSTTVKEYFITLYVWCLIMRWIRVATDYLVAKSFDLRTEWWMESCLLFNLWIVIQLSEQCWAEYVINRLLYIFFSTKQRYLTE